MKKSILVLVLISSLNILWSQSEATVIDHEILISGTSTMHDWTMTADDALITLIKDDITSEEIVLQDIIVEIPVTSLSSEKGKKMDKNTHKALNGDVYPTIFFRSKGNNKLEDGSPMTLKCNGELKIAGTSKDIQLITECTKVSEDIVEFSGKAKVLMSDYQIDPPQFLMGAFKTGDEVIIQFKVSIRDSQIFSNL